MILPVLPKMPHMKCDSGCGKCCGPVLCNRTDIEKIQGYIAENSIVPVRQGITCPFFQAGTCAIYPVRPFVCHMFGHSPRLVCGRGHNVNVPLRREEKLFEEYGRRGNPNLLLHSFVYTEAEVLEIIDDRVGQPEKSVK